MASLSFIVSVEQAGKTLAAVLRGHLPEHSWNQVRRVIESRRVCIADELCLDPARRLREKEAVKVFDQSLPKPHHDQAIAIRHLDEHIAIVEKPAGLATVRHPAERDWPLQHKVLAPTLDDLVFSIISDRAGAEGGGMTRLRIVHRLDKETSGLIVFARSILAERSLGSQFHSHTVTRRYLAIVPGHPQAKRIASRLVRDRGDGRRGSTTVAGLGKAAVTHLEIIERLPRHTLLGCTLETGRTHQIRIHLAEAGHPVCGDKVYNRKPGQEPYPESANAPRLALHAAELGFEHPASGEALHWSMPLPADLAAFLENLRGPKSI